MVRYWCRCTLFHHSHNNQFCMKPIINKLKTIKGKDRKERVTNRALWLLERMVVADVYVSSKEWKKILKHIA